MKAIIATAAGLALAACYPQDPEGTTEDVRAGTLVLGWIEGVPRAGAVEMAAARRLADALSAELEIVEDPVHALVGDLAEGRIHLMAGDLPQTTRLAHLYGMSRPLGNVAYRGEIVPRVIAVRQGENGLLMRLNIAIAESR